MAKTVQEYQKEITKLLKTYRTYSKGLDPQILSLSSAMRNLELANEQIDGLMETTVWEVTRYGEKMVPHPVFKVARDAQSQITQQMKVLGLTVDDLAGTVEEDPLVDLTKKLSKKRKQAVVINPKSKGE